MFHSFFQSRAYRHSIDGNPIGLHASDPHKAPFLILEVAKNLRFALFLGFFGFLGLTQLIGYSPHAFAKKPEPLSETPAQPSLLPPAIQLPPLETVEDQLKFLISIRKKIPSLFANVVNYDAAPITLLENERDLQKKLLENPNYSRLFQDRKLIHLSIDPAPNKIFVGEKTLLPEATPSWKQTLNQGLGRISEVTEGAPFSEEAFQKGLKHLLGEYNTFIQKGFFPGRYLNALNSFLNQATSVNDQLLASLSPFFVTSSKSAA